MIGMTIFKNIKDGKLYTLYNASKDVNLYIAMPYRHKGVPIMCCVVSEFIPISMSDIKTSGFM